LNVPNNIKMIDCTLVQQKMVDKKMDPFS